MIEQIREDLNTLSVELRAALWHKDYAKAARLVGEMELLLTIAPAPERQG